MENVAGSQKHITLSPGDVLLFRSSGIAELFIDYSHVAMFFGYTQQGMPLIVESIGRGATIRSILAYEGRVVRVMRPMISEDKVQDVITAARNIVDNPNSYYDYLCIVRFVIPRIILEEVGLPMPLKYHRDIFMICSELVAESYWIADIEILPQTIVPLPDDFISSSILRYSGDIIITSGLIA